MPSPGLSLNLKTVEAALSNFSFSVINGGKRLFEEGRVRSLKETKRPNSFEGEVTDKQGKIQTVTLAYGGTTWNLLCTCRIGTECKHVYAALLFLSKRLLKKAVIEEKREPSDACADDFFSLVADPAGLTEKETDFVQRLEQLYQAQYDGTQINGRILRGLFPAWPEDDYWSQIELAPSKSFSRVQFWHFVVANLRRRGLEIPALFGKYNDTAGSELLIEEWENAQAAKQWTARYQQESIWPSYEQNALEFRWAIDGKNFCIEARNQDEPKFRPIPSVELHQLAAEWRSGRLQVSSESLLLLVQHFLADGYQPPTRLAMTLSLAGRLNGLFRSAEVRRRTIARNGQALDLESAGVGWEMMEVSSHLYRFQLMQNGRVADSDLLILPGPTTLYLSGSTLLEAGPPPFPVDSLSCPSTMEIPRAAVESSPGMRYAIESIAILPGPLAKRVSRIRPKRVLRVFKEQSDASISMAPQLVDPQNGKVIETSDRSPWSLRRRQIIQRGDHFFAYESSDGTHFDHWIAGLPSQYEPSSKRWRVKNSKRSVELFAKWAQSLPPDVELLTPESLRGVSEKPLEIDLSFGCVDAGNDWFDLRFSWSQMDLQLSPEELRALIDARGDFIQFPSRGYRSLRVGQTQKLLSTLHELGISVGDLAVGPQRLHLLHLRTLLETNLVPKELHEQLENRLAQIKMEVAADIPDTIRTTLRPYQVAGFKYLAYLSSNRFGGILADDMGLGKTLQTLTWMAWLQKMFPVAGPNLIIGPKSVVDNWILEAERHYPSLQISALKKPELGPGPMVPGEVLVINYTQLRLLSADLRRIHWDAVVFDEGQYLKNTTSQTTQSARALSASHKILLTGTPIENKLVDLWSLMHCVMPGALGTQTTFRRDFQDSGDTESRSRLARRVRPFLLRRAKEDVALELPPKIEEDIRVAMEGEQDELYQAELKLARQNLLHIESGGQLDKERFNLLTSLLRLRQICCHPALVGLKSKTATGAKLEALMELLEPLIEQGNKVLVFSQFVEMLHLIEDRIQALDCPVFKLTGKTENRGDLVDEFCREKNGAVFLISLRAGGTGINLATASYVILFDPWWNPAVENQAIDRVHRIGQTKTVFAYRLLIRETVEDKIRQLQIRKSNLAKEVLGEEAFSRALTLEDFRYLLS
jgi:hypothetical protein